jgi:hypothetical protein
MVFTGFLLVLIALSVIFQGWNYEIFEAFKVFVPWLLTGIFFSRIVFNIGGKYSGCRCYDTI